jgi:hypothetical protein
MWDDEPSPWDAQDSIAIEETKAGEVSDGTANTTPLEAWDFRKANLPKADKPHYTLHWVRPLYLNYRYLYDYR